LAEATQNPSRDERDREAPGEAARRALAEAEARRRQAASPRPREIGGRDGPDPVRYGDWEVKGLASDF
jgi:hypothetical protein